MGRVSTLEKRQVRVVRRSYTVDRSGVVIENAREHYAKLAMDLKLKWERNVEAAWRRWNDE